MKKIGLALGSGGWRGLAHVGVIKCLVEHGFEISAIAGCSSGAIVGGAYAATKDITKVEQALGKLSIKDLLLALSDPGFESGIFKGEKTQLLFENFFGIHTIQTMPIKFCAVATNLLTSKPVVITKGNLTKAVRASSSLPGFLKPVSVNDQLLIDGGASLPVPVSVAKKMGVDIVIAVNVYASSFPVKQEKLSNVNILTITQQLLQNNLAIPELKNADIIINPQLKNSTTNSIKNFIGNQAAIDAGYIAMKAKIKKLNSFLVSV